MTVDIKNYRILQVLPHLNSGGLVSGAIEISNALQRSGHFSYVASNGGRTGLRVPGLQEAAVAQSALSPALSMS